MKNFFKNLWHALRTLVWGGTAHQRFLFIVPLLVGVLINGVTSMVGTICIMLLAALVMEIIHSFVPTKTVKVLFFKISVPDFKTYKENVDGEGTVTEVKEFFPADSLFSVYLSVMAYLIYEVLVVIF